MLTKTKRILFWSLPVIVMIMLIPLIQNDCILAAACIAIIAVAFLAKYERRDYVYLIFGFFIMIVSEYFFISTGVEKFERNSLFGVMPLWLPILWSYGFVAIKRSVSILK